LGKVTQKNKKEADEKQMMDVLIKGDSRRWKKLPQDSAKWQIFVLAV
jgi:hypothetical protein